MIDYVRNNELASKIKEILPEYEVEVRGDPPYIGFVAIFNPDSDRIVIPFKSYWVTHTEMFKYMSSLEEFSKLCHDTLSSKRPRPWASVYDPDKTCIDTRMLELERRLSDQRRAK